ncbi:MAG: CAP domain-containing protein [Bacteroidetes bacterium]|nr:CAP domain-containing protein [Bacteroidota bacterium]
MRLNTNITDYYSNYNVDTFFGIANLQQRITKRFVDTDLLDAAVFWFTNVERRKHNLKQFQFHDKLRQAATLHSEQMKRHNFFDHDNDFDTRYKTLTDRINSVKDNTFQGFMSWGENIADYPIIEANKTFTVQSGRLFSMLGTEILPYSYYDFAKIIVDGWMNSPGHRANILNPDFEYLGCGCEKYEKQGNGHSMLYFKLTQNFGGSLVAGSFLFGIEGTIKQNTSNPRVLETKNKFNALFGDWEQNKNLNNMNNYEEIDDVAPSRTFHQLGILCLDGSGSMSVTGNGGITLAESVNRAVREFLGFFKNSAYVNNFSIAVVTFDTSASVHTPTTELANIDDFADYNPMNGHGGGTYTGGALEKAEKLAIQFLNSPDANVIPHDVRIIVMSDGMCGNPTATKSISDRLKQNDKITICTSLFTARANVGDDETSQAKTVLQEIASGVNFYKTVYGEEDLRKFFISSMSAGKKK